MAGGKSMPTVAAKIQHQFLATHTLLTCPHIPPQKAARAAQICKARVHTCPRKQARTRSRPPARPSFSVTHTRTRARTHARTRPRAHMHATQSHSHLLEHEAVPIPAQRPVRLSGTHVCLVRVRHRVHKRRGARRGISRSAAAGSWHFRARTRARPVNDMATGERKRVGLMCVGGLITSPM